LAKSAVLTSSTGGEPNLIIFSVLPERRDNAAKGKILWHQLEGNQQDLMNHQLSSTQYIVGLMYNVMSKPKPRESIEPVEIKVLNDVP
jgi:hypothetical protein